MRLTFDQVTCRYGHGAPALQGITLEVGRGLWLLTGPNGSGKSTLLRCAAGILPPAAGSVRYDDLDGYRHGERYRHHLGYAPQEPGGYPELTARAYLTYMAGLKAVRPAWQAARVSEVLALTHLTAQAGRPLVDLSTGMKARLHLAQSLLNDPDLLLLDEPAAGLDPQERIYIRQRLQDLARDRIVLLATNIPEDCEGVADGVIRLKGGRLESFDH